MVAARRVVTVARKGVAVTGMVAEGRTGAMAASARAAMVAKGVIAPGAGVVTVGKVALVLVEVEKAGMAATPTEEAKKCSKRL